MISQLRQMACGPPRPFQSGGTYQTQKVFLMRILAPSKFMTYLLNLYYTLIFQNKMIGKIRQKLISLAPSPYLKMVDLVCPICDRPIPESQKDAHHLVPKSKGGKNTAYLHRICHRQIHALFTETELATQFNNAVALQEHPEMQRFIHWVKTKPNYFYEKSRKSTRLRET